MITKYIISILASLLFIFFISCEEDLLPESETNVSLEFRGKGGKPEKPGGDTQAITIRDLGSTGGEFTKAQKIAFIDGEIHIVGNGKLTNGDSRGFLWTEANGWQVLGYLYDTLPYSHANDISPGGTIIGNGTSLVPPFYSSEAVIWSINNLGLPNSINPSNSVNSTAEAINIHGDMVGSRVDTCGYEGFGDCGPGSPGDTLSIWSAFMWKNESNTLENIELRTLFGHSKAYAINNSRVVIGRSDLSVFEGPSHYRAVVWEYKDGDNYVDPVQITGLENLWSWAWDINDVGQIVGEYDTLNGVRNYSSAIRGFIAEKNEYGQWEANKLPTLGKKTKARAISKSGYITGNSYAEKSGSKGRGGYNTVAFLYHHDIGIINLGSYKKGAYSEGFDIAEKSENEIIVVGTGDVSGSRHALMWTIDLCKLIPGRCEN